MTKRHWFMTGALILGVIGLSGSLYAAGRPASPNAMAQVPTVKVVKVLKSNLDQMVAAQGTLEPAGVREIRVPFGTSRVRLLVDIGDEVKAGQVLAELDTAEQRLQVATLQAKVLGIRSQLAELRQKQQLDPVLRSGKVESAKAAVLQAEQGVKAAEAVVSERREQAGQAVIQAQLDLVTAQTRVAAMQNQVEVTRARLLEATSAHEANPADPAATRVYQQARTAYEDAVRNANNTAEQTSMALLQAKEALRLAEQRALAAQADDQPEVRAARAKLENARRELDAAKAEANMSGVFDEQIQAAEANLAVAQESLLLAADRLANAVVKAPFDATILTVSAQDGGAAQEGQALFEIGITNQLTVRAQVAEVDVTKVKRDQGFFLNTGVNTQKMFVGTLNRVAVQPTRMTVGNKTGTFYEVRGLVQNDAGLLRPGMSVEAIIRTDSRTGAIVLDADWLREEGGKFYVLVVNTEGKVEIRPATVGLRVDKKVEILQGVQEGDQVITSPPALLRTLQNGASVLPDEGVRPASTR